MIADTLQSWCSAAGVGVDTFAVWYSAELVITLDEFSWKERSMESDGNSNNGVPSML